MSFAAEMRDFLGSMKVIHDMGVDNDRTAKVREEAKKLKADREGQEALTNKMLGEAAANKAGGLSRLASSAIPVPGGAKTEGISSAAPAASSTRVDDDDDDDTLGFADGGSVPAAAGRRPPVRQEELADYVDMALQGLEQWIARFFRAGQAVPTGGGDSTAALEAAAQEVDQYKDQIAQVDKALDPRGVLSEDEIAEVRLGAMMKWKLMQGDHKGAMEVGRALLAFADLQSRRYAALASTALQRGDTKGAAFYGERAASSVIDGKRYKAMPRPDGSFDVAVKDPYTGKVDKAVMTAQQLGQMTNAVMVGKGMQGAMNFAQTHAKGRYVGGFDRATVENIANPPKAGRGGGGRGGRGPLPPADTSQTRAALGAIRSAAQKLQQAEDSGDEGAIRAAQAELEAAKNRFRDMPTLGRGNPETTLANRERLISMAAGEAPGGQSGGTGGTGSGRGGGTAEERREAGASRELASVARKRAAIEAGAPNSFGGPTGAVGPVVARPDPNVGRMVEAVDVERTRRAANKNLDLTAADAAFRGAEARKAFTKDFADLAEPVKNAIDAVSGTEGNSVLDEKQKRELLDLSIRVLSRSDANPETVVRQLYDSMYAPQGKGYGPTPYKVDRDGRVRFGQPGEGELRYDETALPIAADDLRRIDRVADETSGTLMRAGDVAYRAREEKERALAKKADAVERMDDAGLGGTEMGLREGDYLLDKIQFN